MEHRNGLPRANDDAEVPWLQRQMLRLGESVALEAWRLERLKAKGLRGTVWRMARVAWLAGRGFLRDQCLLRASALTYITMLSIVPLLALGFAVAKGFGFYSMLKTDTINPFLNRTFGTLPEAGTEIGTAESGLVMRMAIDQILGFVDGTKFSALGIVGLVLLVWAGLKLLGSVEKAFNDIWGVPRPRTLMRKVADYLAMVVVTPILLLAATGITSAAQGSAFAGFLREDVGLGGLMELGVELVPLVALWAAFTFVYYAMPNARTRFSSAVLGGLVAALLWQGALMLHIRFQIGVASYSAIYAGFAALPIFLVWINVSWVVVLLGAELCFAHQSEPSYHEAPRAQPTDPAVVVTTGLRAAVRIATAFVAGAPPRTTEALALDLALPEPKVSEALAELERNGILLLTEQGEETVWVFARDPTTVRVKEVLDTLRRACGKVDLPPNSPCDVLADRSLSGLETEAASSRYNRTLRELAEEAIAAGDVPGTRPATAEARERCASDLPVVAPRTGREAV